MRPKLWKHLFFTSVVEGSCVSLSVYLYGTIFLWYILDMKLSLDSVITVSAEVLHKAVIYQEDRFG